MYFIYHKYFEILFVTEFRHSRFPLSFWVFDGIRSKKGVRSPPQTASVAHRTKDSRNPILEYQSWLPSTPWLMWLRSPRRREGTESFQLILCSEPSCLWVSRSLALSSPLSAMGETDQGRLCPLGRSTSPCPACDKACGFISGIKY